MWILKRNIDYLTPRSLHRVWESVSEGDRTSLIARWIDAKTEKGQSHKNGDSKDNGSPQSCVGVGLYIVQRSSLFSSASNISGASGGLEHREK